MLKLTFLNIAIFQGIVIGSILSRSPLFKSKTNKYLALALFSLSWSLLNLVMDITGVFESYPLLKVVDILDSVFLFPLLFFLFVINKVNHPRKHSKHLIWFFLPYPLSVVHSILDEVDIKLNVSSNAYFISIISNILELILFLITLFFIPFLLIKTYQFIQFSKNKQEKKWLTYLWLFEALYLLSWLMVILLSLFIERETSNVMHVIALFTTLLIHWVAYFGVYKFKLANEQKKIRALLLNRRTQIKTTKVADNLPSFEETKVSKAHVLILKKPKKPFEDNIYYKELEHLCSDQKIYRDSTLDRNKAAEMLGISPSYVSQMVNSITGENFSTYINQYRVEEVKKLILDKEFQNYSVLSIGLECGFSSKTTYYNWFKKITGITPNTYKKKHQ